MGRDKKMVTMNCNTANQVSIISFLQSQGIDPLRLTNREAWYLSPIRKENTPSFKVDIQLNRWYDHGLGQGGKLVDLGIRILKIPVKDFLSLLSTSGINHVPIVQNTKSAPSQVRLIKVQGIQHPALISYLMSRKVNLQIANLYCSEIHYSINQKSFFGIGFKNDLGGLEIRNSFFKGCIGHKSISSILKSSSSFSLFEGFFDFLSAVQMNLVSESESVIVLNSVNQLESAINLLHRCSPNHINSFFDNDQAGRNCFLSLKNRFPFAADRSQLYSGYKDLNEMITKTQ